MARWCRCRGGPGGLVLFHPAGGDLLAYRELVSLLPGDVVGVQSGEEAASLESMADEYAAALLSSAASPWYLAGWSMGGVLAHAVAARLEAAGGLVAGVTVIDSLLLGEVRGAEATLSYRLGAAFGPFASVVASLDVEVLDGAVGSLLGADLSAVAAWVSTHVPGASVPAQLERQAELTRQHEALLRRHRAPVISAPMAVVWATGSLVDGSPLLDWSAYTKGDVETLVVKGNHYNVLRAPAVAAVASHVMMAR